MDNEALVKRLRAGDAQRALAEGRRLGLEKESLRVNEETGLSQKPHPQAFGSALTHPCITTDYSEALLELVTPPLNSIDAALLFLEELSAFVHQGLDGDMLWANSMPCVVKNDDSIPVARYGPSNPGRMKTIYRLGLGHRYGRSMQTIAGIHFNYSLSAEWFALLREVEGRENEGLGEFRSRRYLDCIRNLRRVAWMIPYLFGSSPAICRNFIDTSGALLHFDGNTLFQPHACSLRMGNIGYQNNLESKIGNRVSYNSLAEYIRGLRHAVTTPHADYQKIGVKAGGQYRQLNANILQIENEHYATLRPKRVCGKEEMLLPALAQRGIDYIELRSLDLCGFTPAGMSKRQIAFLEMLFLYCLLNDSEKISEADEQTITRNEITVAHYGRQKNLMLLKSRRRRQSLAAWGLETCERMAAVCELLSDACDDAVYRRSLDYHRQLFSRPRQTPSARMLDEMRARHESFSEFVWRRSLDNKRHYENYPLPGARAREFKKMASDSVAEQVRIEEREQLPFDEYLRRYYEQLDRLNTGQNHEFSRAGTAAF